MAPFRGQNLLKPRPDWSSLINNDNDNDNDNDNNNDNDNDNDNT